MNRARRQVHPLIPWTASLLLHGGLAMAVWLVPAREHRLHLPSLELTSRKLPTPEAKKPAPKIEPRPSADPRLAMTKRVPKIRQPPPSEPQLNEPPPDKPAAPAPQDTGPRTFGLQMEGTTRAPGSDGVQVPQGDSLGVDPRITKRGVAPPPPPRRGFKESYGPTEEAPVAVITSPPKVLKRVTAEYPEAMKDLGIEGRVILELTVDSQGRVEAVRVVTSLRPELDAVAVAAARQMLFAPATMAGKPVKVKIPYTFTFVLD